MEIKRLFDCIEHQLQHFPKTDMLNAKVNDKWKSYSTQEVKKIVDEFSAGLIELGVSGNDMSDEGTDKIGIISNNRPEWIFTDLAVQQTGAVLVPVYPTTNPLELEFIFKDAAVKIIFVSGRELLEKVRIVADRVPSLQNIYTFDVVEGAEKWTTLLASEPELLQRVSGI